MKQGRLTVGVVGSDLVGIAIAQALQEAGHLVVAISHEEPDTEEKIAVLLPSAKKMAAEQILEVADLILLAVKPGQIEKTVSSLAESKSWRSGQLVVQLSAQHDVEVLKPATMLGAIPLSIHPAMHFTGTSLDLRRIKESYFAVSAPEVALPIVQALVIEMGAEPIAIGSRREYAEAIEVASNFSAMIVNQAIGLLEQAGVENPASVIAPVIESAVDQALSKGHRRIDPEDLIGEN